MDSQSEYTAFPDAQGRAQKVQKSAATASPSSSLALIGAAAALGFGVTFGGMLRGRPVPAPIAPAAVAQAPAAMPMPTPQPLVQAAPVVAGSPAPASSLDLVKSANSAQASSPDTAVSAADLSGPDSTNLVPPPQAAQSAVQQAHLGRTVFTNGLSLWGTGTPPGATDITSPQSPTITAQMTGAIRGEVPRSRPAAGFRKMIAYAGRGSFAAPIAQTPAAPSRAPRTTPPGIFKGIQLNSLGGGPVSLDSWPSARNLVVYAVPWCHFCREATGSINHMRGILAGQGISTRVIVGADRQREVEAYASEFGSGTLLDPQNNVPVHAYPEFMITDQQGTVLRSHFGAFPNEAEALRWAQGS